MIFQTAEALKSVELSLTVQSLKALTTEVWRLLQRLQDTSTLYKSVTKTTRYLDTTYSCYEDYKIPRHYINLLQTLQDTSTVHKAPSAVVRDINSSYFSPVHRISVTTSGWYLPCSVCVCVCVWPTTQLAYRQTLKPSPLNLNLSDGKLRKNFICMGQVKLNSQNEDWTRIRLYIVYVYVQCMYMYSVRIYTVYVCLQCTYMYSVCI
jgi:hypothetical protein